MTHRSLQDVSSGSIQRLHQIAYHNDWGEIQHDAQAEMRERIHEPEP